MRDLATAYEERLSLGYPSTSWWGICVDESSLVLDDIISLSSSFVSIKWSFVKRLRNKVAHFLAHLQPVEIGWRKWEIDKVLISVVNIAQSDMIS